MEEELTIKQALDLAVKKHNSGELNEAEMIYRRILEKVPNNPDALHLLGLIAYQVKKYEPALEYVSKAVKLKPYSSTYIGNLGMIYEALGNEEESTKNFHKALKINPTYANAHLAHYNLGIFYKDKENILKSLEHYNKAIELKNNFSEAYWNRGLLFLLLGKYENGWKDYEHRFKKRDSTDSRIFNKPRWDGSSLNKKILIVTEQGFGDNIQFIRYLKLIKEKEMHIILECKKELINLFKSMPEIDEVIEKENNTIPNINFDYYVHLMSLPKIFNTNLQTIPNEFPYIKADPTLSNKFKKITNSNKFKIGIVWSGNPKQEDNKKRSINPNHFYQLSDIPNIKLISLQKGEASKQLTNKNILNLEKEIKDFADTSAIIENLDLIISVDTSVAHLAGAMNKPTWTLLTSIPSWQWLLNRKDSPWYPSMRLFRQKKQGSWNSVFNEVKDELRNIVNISK